MASKVSENQVQYNVLISADGVVYRLGKIIIKRKSGELMYIPSQTKVVDRLTGIVRYVIDHLFFHRSGRTHTKDLSGSEYIQEYGEGQEDVARPQGVKGRTPISDIGFQEMFIDDVVDYRQLPVYRKVVDGLDVLFAVDENTESIRFCMTIISGTHIVAAYQGKTTPVYSQMGTTDPAHIGVQHRCLGKESGNGDKMLQYSLKKIVGSECGSRTGRSFYCPPDSGIRKFVHDDETVC